MLAHWLLDSAKDGKHSTVSALLLAFMMYKKHDAYLFLNIDDVKLLR